MLVTLLPANDRLVVRRFNVEEAIEKAGIDYLFVTLAPATSGGRRGRTSSTPVIVKSKKGGLKFIRETGPDGLALTKTGVVVWKVPADAVEGDHEVLLTIRDQAGQGNLSLVQVRVTATPAPEREPEKPPAGRSDQAASRSSRPSESGNFLPWLLESAEKYSGGAPPGHRA